MLTAHRLVSLAAFALVGPAAMAQNLPPFDFSDQFYLANGIDPTTIVGRPNGSLPNSIIDNRANGPEFNNIRLLQHTAAYDHSGHPIFFVVTGLPGLASFTNNEAGEEALEIAETYNVYEFPRSTNPQFSVFPKRQDLIADLRNGYFSNDPLGTWKINLVRFTPAAFNTAEGREMLAEIAAENGRDLDGTPLIRTVGEVEDLVDEGFATIDVPPMDGSAGFRWFFCPVIEDPRDGAIAPDAHLEAVDIPAAEEFRILFDCLQRTGDDDCDPLPPCAADFDSDGFVTGIDFDAYTASFEAGSASSDFDGDGFVTGLDFDAFVTAFESGC